MRCAAICQPLSQSRALFLEFPDATLVGFDHSIAFGINDAINELRDTLFDFREFRFDRALLLLCRADSIVPQFAEQVVCEAEQLCGRTHL
ncbi:hypothetical protein [Sphingopyxis terrae]|uniref:hypothetical protein n=1 Tax=Sphingopyxis terrae TaxID=33052 RepID=UPI001C2C3157|nr:hypothetical protein [Sphingopyxis terrae]